MLAAEPDDRSDLTESRTIGELDAVQVEILI